MIKIEILGTGCSKCKALTQRAEQAVRQAGIEAEIVKVTDIVEIANRGILSTPGLSINGILKSIGTLPSIEQIAEWIKNEVR